MQFLLSRVENNTTTRSQASVEACPVLSKLAAAFLVLLVSVSATGASAPSCKNLFSYTPQTPSRLSRILTPLNETRRLVARLTAPKFNPDAFEAALADDRARGQDSIVQPKTDEERLAFYKYMLDQSGRHSYDLELWARQVHPQDMSRLAKSLGRIDLSDGFSPTQIYAAIDRINRFVAADPRTLAGLRKAGVSSINRTLIEQWTDKEITSHSLVEAFDRLGLIKEQHLRQRFVDLLNANPNLVGSVAASSIAVLQYFLAGAPMTFPVVYSKLAVTRLDPELRQLIEDNGFDAAYPFLKAKYGKSAGFDQGFFWARRTYATAMNIYVLSNFYHFILMQTLPSNLWQEKDGTFKLMKACYAYYSRYLNGLIHQDWSATDDQSTPPVMPAKIEAAAEVDDTKVISAHRPELTVPTRSSKISSVPPAPKPKADDVDEKPLKDTLESWKTLNFDDPTHR